MGIDLQEIQSLTSFQRNAKDVIKRLSETGKPGVLTVQGKASVVVQDAEAYQKLLDRLEFLETLAAYQESLESAKSGRGTTIKDFMAGMRSKYQIPEADA